VEVVLREVERSLARAEEARHSRAISSGCWPPSVRVRMRMEELIERCAAPGSATTFNFYRDGDGRGARANGCSRTSTRARTRRCCSSARRPATAGARSPASRSPRSASSPGAGPAEATRDDRPPRARGARARGADVCCWNVVPTHPHPGGPNERRPTRAEVEAAGRSCASSPRASVVAVGGSAQAFSPRRTSGTRATGARPNSGRAATIRSRRTERPPLFMKTWNAKPGEVERRWYLVDAEGRRWASGYADRRHAARQRQARVHAARRHRRLRRGRERREDRGHRLRSSTTRCTTATRATRAGSRAGRSRRARAPADRGAAQGRSRGCSRATACRAPRCSKLKIYAGPEHPHEAQAPTELEADGSCEQAQYRGHGKRKTSVPA
jgi:large subunit ribosomal protein L13